MEHGSSRLLRERLCPSGNNRARHRAILLDGQFKQPTASPCAPLGYGTSVCPEQPGRSALARELAWALPGRPHRSPKQRTGDRRGRRRAPAITEDLRGSTTGVSISVACSSRDGLLSFTVKKRADRDLAGGGIDPDGWAPAAAPALVLGDPFIGAQKDAFAPTLGIVMGPMADGLHCVVPPALLD